MSTERLAGEALAEVLDAAPDGVVLVDSGGRIEYVNRVTEELFGYPRDELRGESVERLVPERLRSRHVVDRTGYGERPRPRPMGLGLQFQGRRRDGSEVPVEISLAPVSAGGERCFVAIVRDATEQRRLEAERLRYAQSLAVEEIVSGLDSIVWESLTPDRETLTYLGGREAVLLGYPRAQWLEPGFWLSVVHADDRVAALTFADAAREQDTFDLVYRLIAADGAVREGRDLVTVVRAADGRIERLRGVITDVTELRGIDQRLTQAQKMEAVGRLAGGIADDFNNLLTIVSGSARRLMGRPDLAGAQDDLAQITTAAERAAQLTRELLTFARRGQGVATRLDLSTVVRELEPMLRRLLAADIVFDFRPGRGLPQVMMDRTAVEQIMMNLFVNASDAMPAGGTLKVTSEVLDVDATEAGRHGRKPGAYVRLSVDDTGTGIPPEVVARIFEPFFSTKGDKGTGMGLATVYGTVNQAGGWLDVESALGEGTTISVILPVAGEAPAAAPDDGEARPTLLLVGDEPALRKLVVTMLEEQGYAVLQAGDGLDAIAVAKRHRGRIDLLLTDIVMPRLSGPELAEQLSRLRPGLEILFMSGYNDSRLVSRGLDPAKVNLLVKPFAPDQLIGRVRALTGQNRSR